MTGTLTDTVEIRTQQNNSATRLVLSCGTRVKIWVKIISKQKRVDRPFLIPGRSLLCS